jgi:hypothetical protein
MGKAPAKSAPKSAKGDPHARIDAIVEVLKANGISLPKGLE